MSRATCEMCKTTFAGLDVLERLAEHLTLEHAEVSEVELKPETQSQGQEMAGIEARLDGVGALVNLHRAITGEDCPRHLAVGMATSAVAGLQAENQRLRGALQAYIAFSKEAALLLDADEDMRCLKLSLAMEGRAPKYRADVDAARTALLPEREKEEN